MKNISRIVFTVLVFVTTISTAQNFQGKAFYQTKTTIDFDFEDSRIPPDRREEMKEMMRKRLEKVFELSFNSTESIYKEEEQLDQPGQGGMRFGGGFGAGKHYKNTKTKIYSQEQNLMGKEFLVKDSLKVLEWTFEDETKMIGNYLCFKATAIKEAPQNNFRFGRRNQDEEDDKPKDSIKKIEVIAWYTIDIPVNQGPDDYWGLPGLILEVSADRTQIVCTKIVINPKEKSAIKAPEKGDVVTEEEFNEIRIKKMKEMQEMYGGGRGGRDGGPPRRG